MIFWTLVAILKAFGRDRRRVDVRAADVLIWMFRRRFGSELKRLRFGEQGRVRCVHMRGPPHAAFAQV